MRFVCDSCRAQYMISDDKVGAKGVKVRCKKCGYVIWVRRSEPGSAPAAGGDTSLASAPSDPPPPAGPSGDEDPTSPGYASQPRAASHSILDGVADDEIGAVFDQALNAGGAVPQAADAPQSPALDPYDDRTREVDASLVQKLLEQAGGPVPTARVSEEPQNGASHDWFVAIDEKQVGPMNMEKMKHLWDRGEIAPDTLCWRAGLSDWAPLSEVQDLASLLAPKPVKPVIVAPASLGSPTSGASAPVESVFNAGSSSKGLRAESGPLAAGVAEEGGSWRPSAASALASLMKEEIAVLARPPAPAPSEAASPGLLDVPTAQANGKASSHRSSTGDQSPARQATSAAPSQPSFPSLYGAYPAKSSRKGLIVGLSVGAGVLLLALAVVTTILFTKPNDSSQGDNPAPKPKTVATQRAPPTQAAPPSRPETVAKTEATVVPKAETAQVAKAEAAAPRRRARRRMPRPPETIRLPLRRLGPKGHRVHAGSAVQAAAGPGVARRSAFHRRGRWKNPSHPRDPGTPAPKTSSTRNLAATRNRWSRGRRRSPRSRALSTCHPRPGRKFPSPWGRATSSRSSWPTSLQSCGALPSRKRRTRTSPAARS